MAFDGLFTKKMVEALQFLVSDVFIKVNQPENDTVILVIRQQRQNHQLLMSIHSSFSRLQLTYKSMTIHLIHQCLQGYSVNI